MANRKNKKYSAEFRIQILKQIDNGINPKVLSQKNEININTIYSWINSRNEGKLNKPVGRTKENFSSLEEENIF
ncbi:transposase [Mesoplasma melaleucae]|nr:transposase [Mesoplasma melaleucae]ATZ17659.1 hypothetical protein EMELA_v1c00740 [Mesoplasma melaleucae]